MAKFNILPLSYFKASGIPSEIQYRDGKNKSNGLTSLTIGSERSRTAKIQISKHKNVLLFSICALCLFWILCFDICNFTFAQQGDEIEFTMDTTATTTPLPKIFRPNIDLSGRGFNREASWPQTVAAKEALEAWRQDIGFGGLYRLQYNLWEISQLSKEKELQEKLLASYEEIIKNISEAGGTVILDLFGTPVNFGRVLDKKSPPRDLRAFKSLVKNIIRDLSCNKRYNIWYEVWSTPDLDDFFLGREQEYLNLYRVIAESVKELKAETKIHIPIGAPSVSWWFQGQGGNTIVTPEKSLIYTLIKFCYHYRLPLDFISWHGYSTDPGAEKASTIYKKSASTLIRDWLSYFDFDRDTPLIVDEWNFDSDANVLAARSEKSFIGASYIPSRMKNMYETGIDYQTYYCLEDFKNNKEGVVRNVGIFSFNPEDTENIEAPKAIYNVFRMLALLGNDMFTQKSNDEFAGSLATKTADGLAILFYNYIDPYMVTNYLTKNIASLNAAERKTTLSIINSDKLEKILQHQLEVPSLRVTNKIKNILKKAQELNDKAKKYEYNARSVKMNIKNLKPVKKPEHKNAGLETTPEVQEDYLYQRYTVDASCSLNCEFVPVETKEVEFTDLYQDALTLNPYSVQLIVFKKKAKEQPQEPEKAKEPEITPPVQATTENAAEKVEAAGETAKESPGETAKEPPKEALKETQAPRPEQPK